MELATDPSSRIHRRLQRTSTGTLAPSLDLDASEDALAQHGPAFLAGGLASTAVDVSIFPLDTLKTRLQSPQGFLRAGGYRGLFNGVGIAGEDASNTMSRALVHSGVPQSQC